MTKMLMNFHFKLFNLFLSKLTWDLAVTSINIVLILYLQESKSCLWPHDYECVWILSGLRS